MNPIGASTAIGSQITTPVVSEEEKKLRKASGELEGLFVSQLFKAMRETVPQEEGIVSGGSGEDIFTGLLDEHLAAETPKHWGGGISEALYRQLRHGLGAASTSTVQLPSADTATAASLTDLRSR